MNLMDLMIKIGVDDQASKKISTITKNVGKGLATATKIGVAAVGAAVTGIATLTTAATKSYAQYEQLVGGVDTLFKESSKRLQEYAANAYMTSGMSANDYMENVTAFSAALINSLDGDTEAAADAANAAMVAMSDNANRMGTSVESIIQTYQSLSRGNFAMLDNLKLGYGGTKTELERLLADAEDYKASMGEIADYDVSNFADIIEAIGVIQHKLGIAGATAQEASTTIQGSLGAMKAAWQNVLVGIADPSKDFDLLVDNFVFSAETAFDNILPVFERSLDGAVDLIDGVLPKLLERLPAIVSNLSPKLIRAGVNALKSLVKGILDNRDELASAAVEVVTELANGILDLAPDVAELGLYLLVSLANGLSENVDEMIPAVAETVSTIADVLTRPESLDALIKAAFALSSALMQGVADSTDELVGGVIQVAENLLASVFGYVEDQFNQFIEDPLAWGEKFAENFVNGMLGGFLFGDDLFDTLKNIFTGNFDEIEVPELLQSGNRHLKTATAETQSQAGGNVESVSITVNAETNASAEDIGEEVARQLRYALNKRRAASGK